MQQPYPTNDYSGHLPKHLAALLTEIKAALCGVMAQFAPAEHIARFGGFIVRNWQEVVVFKAPSGSTRLDFIAGKPINSSPPTAPFAHFRDVKIIADQEMPTVEGDPDEDDEIGGAYHELLDGEFPAAAEAELRRRFGTQFTRVEARVQSSPGYVRTPLVDFLLKGWRAQA